MRQRARFAGLAGLLAGVLGLGGVSGLHAQATGGGDATAPQGSERGGERGGFAGMAHAMGEVTAVSGTTLTLKTEDGSTVQVVTTENTRVTKDRATVKVADLHPGDGLMALGLMDTPNKTLHAAMIFAQDAAAVKAMRENLGKTYITGRVTAVDLDNAKATVERADHVSQTIGFDEATSFKRAVRGNGGGGQGSQANGSAETNAGPRAGGHGPGGGFGGGMGMGGAALGAGFDRAFSNGESITLADIKPGDFLSGTGALKNGVFVPSRVVDSPPRSHRNHEGDGAPAASGGVGPNPGPGQR